MKYFVYILKSLRDGEYYIGISPNPEQRLKIHNSGGNKSTARRKPLRLIYKELTGNLREARTREKLLKSYKGVHIKRQIIAQHDK